MAKRPPRKQQRPNNASAKETTPPVSPRGSSATSGDALGDRSQLARQVLELRLAGCGYPEICQLLGLDSNWQVWKLLRQALKLAPQEGLVLLQRLELSRLDRLIRSLWRQAVQGDLPVLDRLLKLLGQRERLLRHWRREEQRLKLPTLTLKQALAADRQLESWLRRNQPPAPAG